MNKIPKAYHHKLSHYIQIHHSFISFASKSMLYYTRIICKENIANRTLNSFKYVKCSLAMPKQQLLSAEALPKGREGYNIKKDGEYATILLAMGGPKDRPRTIRGNNTSPTVFAFET